MTKMTNDNWIWKAMLVLGIAGIIFMALVSISGGTFFNNHDVLNYFVTFGISLLVSGACFCFGALMGFLFGIPRIINSTNNAQQTRGTVLQNDNLVQISDWLTKILVGVGLTQIYAIPGFLRKVGNFLSPCFDVGNTGAAIAICLVLYFLILGFMACYLWTRFYFSEMLEQTINEKDEADKQQEDNVNKMVNTTVHNMTINSSDAATHDPFSATAHDPVTPNPSQPEDTPDAVPPASPPEDNADADQDLENPPFNPADANEPEDPDPTVKP